MTRIGADRRLLNPEAWIDDIRGDRPGTGGTKSDSAPTVSTSVGRRCKDAEPMNKPTPSGKDLREILDLPPAVEERVERVHELPGIRAEKVRATREAIHQNAYENEQVLDVTIAHVGDELELLVERGADDSSV